MAHLVMVNSEDSPTDEKDWQVPTDRSSGGEFTVGWPMVIAIGLWGWLLITLVRTVTMPTTSLAANLLAMSLAVSLPLQSITLRRAHLIRTRKLWSTRRREMARMILLGILLGLLTISAGILFEAFWQANAPPLAWALLTAAACSILFQSFAHWHTVLSMRALFAKRGAISLACEEGVPSLRSRIGP